MKIAVIIPAYNEARHIEAALASVLMQDTSGMAVEIVVVDDGSTDATASVVERIAQDKKGITLIRQENRGVSAARNAGLASLDDSVTHVTFLDADDQFPAGRLAADIAAFAARPEVSVVYGKMALIDADNETMVLPENGERRILRGISCSAGTFTRAAIDKVVKFDTEYLQAEDFDFLLRLFEQEDAVALPDRVVIYYRQHAGNATADKTVLKRYFMRAILMHSKRRKVNPSLHSVEWLWASGANE